MRVKLEKEYRKLYTLEDLDRAKGVIAHLKANDDSSAIEMAEYAVREALRDNKDHWLKEIVKAEAHTARNNRVWNAYYDGSENMDVWITFVAETWHGFISGGAYLTDIWQTGAVHYADEMYFRIYEEVET